MRDEETTLTAPDAASVREERGFSTVRKTVYFSAALIIANFIVVSLALMTITLHAVLVDNGADAGFPYLLVGLAKSNASLRFVPGALVISLLLALAMLRDRELKWVGRILAVLYCICAASVMYFCHLMPRII